MHESVDVLILGAGIAGLGAAHKAKELERPALICEARASAGGLLDNFMVQGFRFDHAVHLSFATETEVRQIFDRTPYVTHPADSLCFEQDRWLKHPIQNNLYPLNASDKVELIESFVYRPEFNEVSNYDDWLRHQYGHKIAERYPIRYTRKYWDTPAVALSVNWIGNRMRRAELSEILFGAFTADTPNTYYTKEMRYPRKGGYKQFIQCLIDEANIKYQKVACELDLIDRIVRFEDGSGIRYNKLVSSLPLPVLANITSHLPETIRMAADKLEATSIDLISIGFKRAIIDQLWFYIYDEDILASRAYSPSVKSLDNAPAGCSSLQFEVYQRGRHSKWPIQTLIDNTRQALRKMKLATDDDILFMDHRRLPWGNVVFDQGMERYRDEVRAFYKQADVSTIGRFGEWDYLWSNQSLLSGMRSLS
jgi:protoporphyrinogen oxidase